jgi:hypothetical protein
MSKVNSLILGVATASSIVFLGFVGNIGVYASEIFIPESPVLISSTDLSIAPLQTIGIPNGQTTATGFHTMTFTARMSFSASWREGIQGGRYQVLVQRLNTTNGTWTTVTTHSFDSSRTDVHTRNISGGSGTFRLVFQGVRIGNDPVVPVVISGGSISIIN